MWSSAQWVKKNTVKVLETKTIQFRNKKQKRHPEFLSITLFAKIVKFVNQMLHNGNVAMNSTIS